jgi:hypothetical protein
MSFKIDTVETHRKSSNKYVTSSISGGAGEDHARVKEHGGQVCPAVDHFFFFLCDEQEDNVGHVQSHEEEARPASRRELEAEVSEHRRPDDGHAPDVLRAKERQQRGSVQEQHVHEQGPPAGRARVPDGQHRRRREQDRAGHQRADPVPGAVILLGIGYHEHEHEHERPWQQEQDRDVDRHLRRPRAGGKGHRDGRLAVRRSLCLLLLRRLLLHRGWIICSVLSVLVKNNLVAEDLVCQQVHTNIKCLHPVEYVKYSETTCLVFYCSLSLTSYTLRMKILYHRREFACLALT